MNRTKKAEVVTELKERLSKSPNLYMTDFTGIAVKPMTELRSRMRSAGVDYLVVKNTLALRAFQEASVSGVEEVLEGPTAFVFVGDDPVVAAKLISDFRDSGGGQAAGFAAVARPDAWPGCWADAGPTTRLRRRTWWPTVSTRWRSGCAKDPARWC